MEKMFEQLTKLKSLSPRYLLESVVVRNICKRIRHNKAKLDAMSKQGSHEGVG